MYGINRGDRRSRIVATSSFLPNNTVTNEELIQFYGGLSQNLFNLLGIEERRWVFWPRVWVPENFDPNSHEINTKALDDYLKNGGGDQKTLAQLIIAAPDTAMQYLAARRLLDQTGYSPDMIDKIYSVTSTPDDKSPRAGQLISYWLGLDIPAVSGVGGCAEALKHMMLADADIRGHHYKTVLVVTSNMTSKQVSEAIINAQKETDRQYVPKHPDRIDAALFGDASSAVLMLGEEGDPQEKGLFAWSEKSHGDVPLATYPSRKPLKDEYDVVTWKLSTKEIRNVAPVYLTDGIRDFLEATSLSPKDVGKLLLHPGSDAVFNQAVAIMSELYELPEEEIINKAPRMYRKTGNLSNSGIPVLIDRYWEEITTDPKPHILGAVGGGSDIALVGVRF